MRVKLNLAVAPTLHERFAFAASAPIALAAAILMVGLVLSMLANLRSTREVDAKLASAEQREKALIQRETELRKSLERPEFRSTLREAQFVDSLIEKKQLSLSTLAVKVAALLPADARLSGLALTRSDNDSTVRFEVNGKDAQALEAFLGNLTKSADFEDPVITSEGFQRENAPAGEVTVACTARYVGERETAGQAAAGK